MYKIAIRFCATQRVRHLSAFATSANQSPHWLHAAPLRQRLNTDNPQLSAITQQLSLVAFAAITDAHVRADSNEESTLIDNKQLFIEENDADIHETTQINQPNYPFPVKVVHDMLYVHMDAPTRTFLYTVIGANCTVYTAFSLAYYLENKPNPRPGLLRFLSRNFVLSLGWLTRRRWHVLLTSTVTHFSVPHLFRSTGMLLAAVYVCSLYLNVWQIMALYLGGGIVGGSVSMALARFLRKTKYMAAITGSSDNIYALLCYYAFAQDVELSAFPWLPVSLLIKASLLLVLAKDGIGLRKFLLYGYHGKGPNAISIDHAAHLGGALTGILAYGVPRTLEGSTQGKVSNNDVTESMQEGERIGTVEEGTSLAHDP